MGPTVWQNSRCRREIISVGSWCSQAALIFACRKLKLFLWTCLHVAPLLSFLETGDELKCPSDYGLPDIVLNVENRQKGPGVDMVFDPEYYTWGRRC